MSSPKIGEHDPYHVRDAQDTAAGAPAVEAAASPVAGKSDLDTYLERVAGDCVACKAQVEGRIRAKCGDYALAEEVVDEAIERVMNRARRYGLQDEVKDVRAFLVTTAKNLLIDALAKRSVTVPLDVEGSEGVRAQALDPSSEKIMGRVEVSQMIRIAQKNATQDELKLLQMRFEFDMSFEAIGRALGFSHVTARHRLAKVLAMMRSEMNRQPRH